VQALTRAGRTDPARLEDARLLFEQVLGYANHLGLYGEQTGASGEALAPPCEGAEGRGDPLLRHLDE
jgi:hypothetical protein